jgi:hypothetical protein
MEINLKQMRDEAVQSTTGNNKAMRLSENASSMVFQLFTKNVYSNPIGTVVREIASNCFDSHIEAGVNAPVLIRKSVDNQTNTTYISFIDYGVGMCPDRVENIYGVYFESTKRQDNTQIGGFGIGGKTPLAYKRSTGNGEGEYDNSFYVITNFNGTKYFYCIYEGQESPVISLLHSENTDERNGTEIRIPVLERDMASFEKEMVRQLYYFENIIFEGFGRETLNNQYQIVRGKSFLFRGNEYSDYIHMCLGRVAYPLDYNVLGLSSNDYRLPIALKLEVGEIGVTVSRESLDYSEATIKIIKKKLEIAKKEISSLIEKQYDNIVTLEDYFKVKNNFGLLYFSNGFSINVGNLISHKDINYTNFKYNDINMPSSSNLFKFFFTTKSFGKKSRSRYSSRYVFEGSYEEIQRNKEMLYINGVFNRKVVKQAYLKSVHGMFHIISRRDLTEKFIVEEITELFNSKLFSIADSNGSVDAFIVRLQEMQKEYFDIVLRFAKDYDKVEVPDDFILDRKKGLSKNVRNSNISVTFVNGRSRNSVKLDDLFKYREPIFYGTEVDSQALSDANYLFSTLFNKRIIVTYYDRYANGNKENPFQCGGRYNYSSTKNPDVKKSIMFIKLAENNVKYMKYCKNAYHVSEFFHKMLYRKEEAILNYFRTYGIYEKYNSLGSLYKKDKVFTKIDLKWGKRINELNKYFDTIPEAIKESDIGDIKHLVRKFFAIDNEQQTKEDEKISKKIDDLMFLKQANADLLKYIDLPYNLDTLDSDSKLFDILKKIMVL